jgi:hypothetical protein
MHKFSPLYYLYPPTCFGPFGPSSGRYNTHKNLFRIARFLKFVSHLLLKQDHSFSQTEFVRILMGRVERHRFIWNQQQEVFSIIGQHVLAICICLGTCCMKQWTYFRNSVILSVIHHHRHTLELSLSLCSRSVARCKVMQ